MISGIGFNTGCRRIIIVVIPMIVREYGVILIWGKESTTINNNNNNAGNTATFPSVKICTILTTNKKETNITITTKIRILRTTKKIIFIATLFVTRMMLTLALMKMTMTMTMTMIMIIILIIMRPTMSY